MHRELAPSPRPALGESHCDFHDSAVCGGGRVCFGDSQLSEEDFSMRNNKKMRAIAWAVPALLLSSPVLADCNDDLLSVSSVMTSVSFQADQDTIDAANTLIESARSLCTAGDQAAANEQIGEIRELLGLSG